MTKAELQTALDATVAEREELREQLALRCPHTQEDCPARAALRRINSNPRWASRRMHGEAVAALRAAEPAE